MHQKPGQSHVSEPGQHGQKMIKASSVSQLDQDASSSHQKKAYTPSAADQQPPDPRPAVPVLLLVPQLRHHHKLDAPDAAGVHDTLGVGLSHRGEGVLSHREGGDF
jgi:hypothetical protein